MKHWFKYEHGYINIDDRNIYLTNSGNWSEVEDLKKRNVRHSENRKKRRIQFFLFIVILVTGIIMLLRINKDSYNVISLVGAISGIIVVYKYMRSELGPRYMIPFSRIKRIENIKTITYIYYLVEQEREKVQSLANLEKAGLDYLDELKQSWPQIK